MYFRLTSGSQSLHFTSTRTSTEALPPPLQPHSLRLLLWHLAFVGRTVVVSPPLLQRDPFFCLPEPFFFFFPASFSFIAFTRRRPFCLLLSQDGRILWALLSLLEIYVEKWADALSGGPFFFLNSVVVQSALKDNDALFLWFLPSLRRVCRKPPFWCPSGFCCWTIHRGQTPIPGGFTLDFTLCDHSAQFW